MKYNLNNPTLILFHADWCGHCNRFMPTFDQFSKAVNKKKLNIIKLNADTNSSAVKSFNVEGFPTLLLMEAKSKKFKNYNGDRTLTDLVKFVNDNARIDITK
jgi:protein disulfide-isomerase-like protein